MTKARDLSKLLSTSNGKIAGSNLDVSFENISDTGTEGTKVASGTTAQRGSTAGQWRYNTTTGFFEGRGASSFSTLEPIPTITSVDVTTVDTNAGGNVTFVITGTNFSSGGTIVFVGNAGTDINASTTTFNSATQVTAVAPNASFLNAQEPYKIKFTSATGVTGTSGSGLINVNTAPTWTTAAGSLGIIYDSARGNTLTVAATDADSDTIAYSVQSGSLPAGASLNSSNGQITGFSAVGSDTTSSFDIRATAGGKTADRNFNITVKPPVTTVFNYTGGDQSWTVPTGLTSVNVWLWGAGGGSDNQSNRGGAGGFIKGTLAVSAGDHKIVVGQGGQGGNNDSNTTNYVNVYGGGGAGYENASGGGLSGIFTGSGAVFQSGTNPYNSQSGHWTPVPTDHSRTLVVAGGGGGGDPGSQFGGGAGYPTGSAGVDGNGTAGQGGTQSAGGNYGGGLLVGGDGNTRNNISGGGTRWLSGGGAGYYGGGYPAGNDSGGGGGSNGYSNALTNVTTHTSSVTRDVEGTSESNYGNNAGYGGNGNNTPTSGEGYQNQGGGYYGRVVISY